MVAFIVLISAACSAGAELEFGDWTLPVPEGIPIYEYAPVRRDERAPRAIRLEEDLVIGGDADSMFYSTPTIAVAADGTIYVLDQEDRSVRAFAPDGTLIRTFGRAGQGPGEMESGLAITVAGERILVADGLRSSRLLVFSLDGESLSSPQTQDRFGREFHGLPDGTFVDSLRETVDDGTVRRFAARFDASGEQQGAYVELQRSPIPSAMTSDDGSHPMLRMIQGTMEIGAEPPPIVKATGRQIYLLDRAAYEMLATDVEARPLWAARVAWSPPPYEESRKRPHLRAAERAGLDPSALDFPPLGPAIDEVRVDGHGRVFVFPNPGDQPEGEPYVPVDVFAPDGEMIAAGFAETTWTTARGDHVYGWRHDEDSDDWYVVRYRLLVNGQ